MHLTPTEHRIQPYTDVADDEWYARYVRYAYSNDLVASDATLYEPNVNGNRAFIAQTLLKILELRDLVTSR